MSREERKNEQILKMFERQEKLRMRREQKKNVGYLSIILFRSGEVRSSPRMKAQTGNEMRGSLKWGGEFLTAFRDETPKNNLGSTRCSSPKLPPTKVAPMNNECRRMKSKLYFKTLIA